MKTVIKSVIKKTLLIAFIASELFVLPAQSSIPESSRHITFPDINFSLVTNVAMFDNSNDFSLIPIVLSNRRTTYADVAQVIPTTGLTDTNDSGKVASHVLEFSLNNFLKAQKESGTFLGTTADDVQKSMQTNVSFGGEEEDSIKHNFDFKVKAAEGRASLGYTGLMNAELSYHVGPDREKRAAIFHDLDTNTKLVIDHTDKVGERIERVSLNWNF